MVLWCVLAASLLGASGALVCPDGGACQDGSTCCKDFAGRYGCCPLPRAVCCSDGLHCCPEGTACDLQHATCSNQMLTLPWRRSLPPQQRMAATLCPDGQSECPDATTCCQLLDGSWGCCPLAKAVCCADKLHCCPKGTVCDLASSRCMSPGGDWRPLMDKLPATPRVSGPGTSSTPCPGGASLCPDTFTCCQRLGGDYGCCPMPDATCCSDGLHCCPRGTACNLAAGTCDGAASVLAASPPMAKGDAAPGVARLAKTAATTGVTACDERTGCPKGASCCFMKSAGEWGCCPLPQAVCCQDGSHCCPAGHTCRPGRASCSRGFPWLAKRPAAKRPAAKAAPRPPPALADVKCDDKSSCAAGTTCCKLPSGEWGCCPLLKAVCCADREHCCPQGYSCNMETGTCEKPAAAAVPCDAASACGERETCCRSSASGWACCPSPQAVCCDDTERCCPARHSCGPGGTCVLTSPVGLL
ncbi:granulin b isoform X1 [Syngnathus acus]|uniref:granulin b isoform X1 n=2 Tax=Syngnathus acus TaxID=161584 RepID=UPI001885E002|nr:granulin b isoform X1 [Syngnathus acus]XP_037133248.1 granulin b isoform X1 [Syngnathus acus]